MPLLRFIGSMLLAVAIAFAPLASASANVAKVAAEAKFSAAIQVGDTAMHRSNVEHTAATAQILTPAAAQSAAPASVPMADCAAMIRNAFNADNCPGCARDDACAPEFCVAKSVQLIGISEQACVLLGSEKIQLRPAMSAQLAARADRPQPPIPRT